MSKFSHMFANNSTKIPNVLLRSLIAVSVCATSLLAPAGVSAQTVGTPALASGSDSGVAGDGITNDTTPTLTGSCTTGHTVTILDTALSVGSATCASGAYSITTSALLDGPHALTASHTNGVLPVGVSLPLALVIDTQPPLALLAPPLLPTSDTGRSLVDGITRASPLTFAGVCLLGDRVTLVVNGTSVSPTTDCLAAAYTLNATLAEGTHAVRARASDAAGNTVDSPATTVTVDRTTPSAPIAASITPGNGSPSALISAISGAAGNAEPNATIDIALAGGVSLCQPVVQANGSWSCALAVALPIGTPAFTVTATDAAGNQSAGTTITLTPAIAPEAPTIYPSNGTVIAGKGQPNSTVLLTLPGSTLPVSVPVDANGDWSYTPTSQLLNNAVVVAVGTNASGLLSASAQVTIDRVGPGAPIIQTATTSVVSGTAEANATVLLTVPGLSLPVSIPVDAQGRWSYTSSTPLLAGGVVVAIAVDPAGNAGLSTTATISPGSTGQLKGTIRPSNGTTVSGTAPANGRVSLRIGNNPPIAVQADSRGNWVYTPTTPIADGTLLVATITDSQGQKPTTVSTIVDGIAPAKPTIDLNTTDLISGTAEPGTTILLTIPGSVLPVAIPVDEDGVWSYVPTLPLSEGLSITAVAVDAAGNISQPALDIITSTDPLGSLTPTIALVSPTRLEGTGQIGSIVRLILPDGSVDEVPVDKNGNWSYTLSKPLASGERVYAIGVSADGEESIPNVLTMVIRSLNLPLILRPQTDVMDVDF